MGVLIIRVELCVVIGAPDFWKLPYLGTMFFGHFGGAGRSEWRCSRLTWGRRSWSRQDHKTPDHKEGPDKARRILNWALVGPCLGAGGVERPDFQTTS